MHKLTLFYVIHNNGDGSASARFYESKELASWAGEHDEEGFTDSYPCEINITSKSPILADIEPTSKEEYFLEFLQRLSYRGEDFFEDEEIKEFKEKFFSGSNKPHFTVTTQKNLYGHSAKGYLWNIISFGGKESFKIFLKEENSGSFLEQKLNS